MAPIRRLVLDVLKPHDPPLTDIAASLAALDGVDGVNISLVEIDQKVTNLKVTIEGANIDDDAVKTVVENHGGSVHSVDEVACGERLVEASQTPQD